MGIHSGQGMLLKQPCSNLFPSSFNPRGMGTSIHGSTKQKELGKVVAPLSRIVPSTKGGVHGAMEQLLLFSWQAQPSSELPPWGRRDGAPKVTLEHGRQGPGASEIPGHDPTAKAQRERGEPSPGLCACSALLHHPDLCRPSGPGPKAWLAGPQQSKARGL